MLYFLLVILQTHLETTDAQIYNLVISYFLPPLSIYYCATSNIETFSRYRL
jgi:hypothetical protein